MTLKEESELDFKIDYSGRVLCDPESIYRINRLPRIITVSGLKMGTPKMEQGRIVSQAQFDLVAYAAPTEKQVAATAAVNGAKPALVGK